MVKPQGQTSALIKGRKVNFKSAFEQLKIPKELPIKRFPLLEQVLQQVEYIIQQNKCTSKVAVNEVVKKLLFFYTKLKYETVLKNAHTLSVKLAFKHAKATTFYSGRVNNFGKKTLPKIINFIKSCMEIFPVIDESQLDLVDPVEKQFYIKQKQGIGYIHWNTDKSECVFDLKKSKSSSPSETSSPGNDSPMYGSCSPNYSAHSSSEVQESSSNSFLNLVVKTNETLQQKCYREFVQQLIENDSNLKDPNYSPDKSV